MLSLSGFVHTISNDKLAFEFAVMLLQALMNKSTYMGLAKVVCQHVSNVDQSNVGKFLTLSFSLVL